MNMNLERNVELNLFSENYVSSEFSLKSNGTRTLHKRFGIEILGNWRFHLRREVNEKLNRLIVYTARCFRWVSMMIMIIQTYFVNWKTIHAYIIRFSSHLEDFDHTASSIKTTYISQSENQYLM